MSETKCRVFWCTALKATAREVCELHAKRPVLHSVERYDEYTQRLYNEDAAARSRRKTDARHAAPQPVPLIPELFE